MECPFCESSPGHTDPRSVTLAYLDCFHWSVVTASTVGYGDIPIDGTQNSSLIFKYCSAWV
jgi:Ion channel